MKSLKIPADRQTNTAQLSENVVLGYANKTFESNTKHFVWVDIDRQRVYVLVGKKGNWKIEKIIICATGVNKSPTTRGTFEISDKGTWFYSDRLKSGAMYWSRFNESYLFHSVAMDKNRNVTDSVLGENAQVVVLECLLMMQNGFLKILKQEQKFGFIKY